MKNTKTFSLYITFLLLIVGHGFAQLPKSLPKNKYGLEVISSATQYFESVKGSSNKKMVRLSGFVQPLFTDFKYATAQNFTHIILYKNPRPYLRLEAATALKAVCSELLANGMGIKIFDAYRPYSITEKMWEVVPDERYAANPAKGSGHNRGAAVDVTLIDIATKKELLMPTTFDDFTEKAHHDYMGLDSIIIKNRALLKGVMEKHGFIALETEWWHYYLPDAAKKYELIDLDFKAMKKIAGKID